MARLEVDAVVIGGGVVGLAVGCELARRGREVVLLEAEPALGAHASSRNSEVIHAGIYYPTGSIKARSCVRGRRLLYEFCEREGVAYRRVGKLIVAAREEEVSVLARLSEQAAANGVDDLCWLSAAEVSTLEPQVAAVSGVWSPSTGIVDSHGLLQALRRKLESRGGTVSLRSPVRRGRVGSAALELEIGGDAPTGVSCRSVVNAAGLFAQTLARNLSGLDPLSIPEQHFAKGHYFVLNGQSPFRHLVYPVPEIGGLGVHATLDLSGRARFGPDVAWCTGVDYRFEEGRADAFYAAIRRYFPALAAGTLMPGYVGVRPKLAAASAPACDFQIQGPREHGVPGLVNLYGIESPGLTACLALAELVAAALGEPEPPTEE